MTIETGKIVEATESELYSHWLKRGYDELYAFDDYMELCEENGTKVTNKDGAE